MITANEYFAKMGYVKDNDASDLCTDEFRHYVRYNEDGVQEDIFINFDAVNAYYDGSHCGLYVDELYAAFLALKEMKAFNKEDIEI